jgi:hypothetical protein
VGHRAPGEPGEQVLDRELGHPLARAWVAEPMCGVTIRFGAAEQRVVGGSGSGSVTSSAAPAIVPSSSARRSATWSTIGPRAVLIEDRRRPHPRSAAASIRWRVAGVSGQCRRDEVRALEQGLEAGSNHRPAMQEPPLASGLLRLRAVRGDRHRR